MKRFLRVTLIVVAVAAAALFILNSSRLAARPEGETFLIAHRGLGQTFHREGLTGETCTAERIFPPEHPYIENTLPSIQAAFDYGADMVEFDVQPTTDGEFVIFHDWTLDCRTDGTGQTRAHSLAELRALDLGYGYTADGGLTFPFRGKFVGMMPTLGEVLDAIPGRRFLINIKSDDPEEGRLLAEHLARRTPEDRARLAAYGGARPLGVLKAALPDIEVFSSGSLKDCLLVYGGVGWSGYVPEACRGGLVMLPLNVAPWFWGFPNRMTGRLAGYGSELVILGDYDGSGFSSGVDTEGEFARIPSDFRGGIWTNRVDRIGPLMDRFR
jgi:glycerophosphoryl diester phosphodiesterase